MLKKEDPWWMLWWDIYRQLTFSNKKEVGQDNWQSSLNKPVSKLPVYLPVYKSLLSGGNLGCLPNCLTMWQSKVVSGGYHSNMNFTSLSKWSHESLIPICRIFLHTITLSNRKFLNGARKVVMTDCARKDVMTD